MEIKTATANLSGGYDLTFEKGDPATVTTRDRTPESLALIAWMREGNVPSPWVPTPEEAEIIAGVKAKKRVRGEIKQSAGDTLTMLGTTSDAAAISTLGIAALTVALASSSDYGKFKMAFLGALGELAGDHDMVAISGSFLQKIKDQEVLIPALIKQLPNVMSDIETRSTAVSRALIAAPKQV